MNPRYPPARQGRHRCCRCLGPAISCLLSCQLSVYQERCVKICYIPLYDNFFLLKKFKNTKWIFHDCIMVDSAVDGAVERLENGRTIIIHRNCLLACVCHHYRDRGVAQPPPRSPCPHLHWMEIRYMNLCSFTEIPAATQRCPAPAPAKLTARGTPGRGDTSVE